jgi:H(+)-translocating pyrophosphatase
LTENADISEWQKMFETIAGYGLGGSTIALFGRVGGGIYTKAADVGADLAGKILVGLPEDSPDNPGVIADNVGDNVGDIAGMGSDLFGSLAESTCAALVVSGTSKGLIEEGVYYPLMITATGILVSIVTVLFAQGCCCRIKYFHDVEKVIKWQIILSTLFEIPVLALVSNYCLPETFGFDGVTGFENVTKWDVFGCTLVGLIAGFLIGLITEFYTSNEHSPVRNVSNACKTGAAVSIIQGLALGYLSTIIPVFAIAVTIYVSFSLANMYGIACAALGMLSTLCVGLAIDGYGPISDNAGGIAEMSELDFTRERTDCLDAAGNTTAAIGKGFAIGSACLVALALFGAFATRTGQQEIDVLKPLQFAGLIIGAMLPYAFTALTMKAVGTAA